MDKDQERRQSKEGEFGGIIFVACMFIGGGLGFVFGEVAAGWLLGMGAGFLLMGLVRARRIEPSPVTVGLPSGIYRIALTILGIFIIVCGLALLYRHTAVMVRFLPGVALVAIGVIVLIAGVGRGSKSEGSSS